MSGKSPDRFEQQRLRKLEQIEALGFDPWGQRFDGHMPIEQARALAPEESGSAGEHVRVAGRIMLRRKAGKLRFYDIQDWTGRIQLLFSRGDLPDEQWQLLSAVDLGDLSTVQVGALNINARTFVTDDEKRNSAIRNRILHTDQYEFITFTPTEIAGLSGGAVPGQSYTFQITGDLTIRDITQTETFDVEVQVVSENQLSGVATSVIPLVDYNLQIPDVPFVANVGDEITLEFRFAALSN